jgi:hypothetical protein
MAAKLPDELGEYVLQAVAERRRKVEANQNLLMTITPEAR